MPTYVTMRMATAGATLAVLLAAHSAVSQSPTCLTILVDGVQRTLCEGDPPPTAAPPTDQGTETRQQSDAPLVGNNMRDLMRRADGMDLPGRTLKCRSATLEGMPFNICE